VPDPTPQAVRSAAVVLGPLALGRLLTDTHSDPIDEDSLTAEPLIDEPVTSGGDSTTWTPVPNAPEKPK
jgi:hypothetical protein